MSKTFPESPQLAAYMGLLYGYEDSEPSERPNHRRHAVQNIHV
ncbi:unnamed protein product [Penicillium roqueforti FM164]|uniref:Uncharacterized protein n=1 Tax=Penicillium roqueforti (strain FM164) TaxID=1365484 RepID=W6QKG4_PENRF|nr:unnamed protein product [Penicillium roqueforti FM164]